MRCRRTRRPRPTRARLVPVLVVVDEVACLVGACGHGRYVTSLKSMGWTVTTTPLPAPTSPFPPIPTPPVEAIP